jgi:Na+-driven multidrug efflux pump
VSATVGAAEANGTADASGGASRDRRRGATPAPSARASSSAKRTRVAWYWRLVAWIVAVPLAFVVTAWPAYKFGFISKDDLLDIFVGNGIGRYVRLGIVTIVWALVTALLVQLFVEGGRARAARRRRARTVAA